jgi:hypothetical protein
MQSSRSRRKQVSSSRISPLLMRNDRARACRKELQALFQCSFHLAPVVSVGPRPHSHCCAADSCCAREWTQVGRNDNIALGYVVGQLPGTLGYHYHPTME